MTKTEVIERLRREKPYLRETFGLSQIGLFGSFACDRQTDESDIDLVMEFERSPGIMFVELADYMERVLKRKVDVLTVAGISSIRNKGITKSIQESIIYV